MTTQSASKNMFVVSQSRESKEAEQRFVEAAITGNTSQMEVEVVVVKAEAMKECERRISEILIDIEEETTESAGRAERAENDFEELKRQLLMCLGIITD